MPEMLQEYVDSGNQQLRVDRTAGVIRGVKVLGLQSRNGRRYRERALAEAVKLYEGAKVNVNHPKGHPLSPRDYQDRLGVICGVQLRPSEGLFGDLHFNPKHALSEQLMWDAEHASQNVGLSHNVLAQTTREGNETIVEAITKVQSIDLVADPATTRGLFEQDGKVTPDDRADGESSAVAWDDVTVEQLRLHRPDLLRELDQAQTVLLEDMRTRLDEFAARDAAVRRRNRVAELLHEHGLPTPDIDNESARHVVSEQFVETLMNAADDRTVRRLIEERAALVRSAQDWQSEHRRNRGQPVSRDQVAVAFGAGGSQVRNAREFAAAVRGR
jgi:hypothetical protein